MTIIPTDPIRASTAARILGISPRHVRRLVGAGKLVGAKTELGYLIPRQNAERLAHERASQAACPDDYTKGALRAYDHFEDRAAGR